MSLSVCLLLSLSLSVFSLSLPFRESFAAIVGAWLWLSLDMSPSL